MSDLSLATQVERYGWYHTLDLGDGVVTLGMFDHRPKVQCYLIPEDLTGMRCLDIGTYDGFWAFEMERRGAAEVVALDIEDPEALDWPHSLREKTVKTLDIEKGERFALAKQALGSNVERVLCSVYDLDDRFGTFDFIFNGDMLIHLKDPVTAVERMLGVCRGSTTICNPVIPNRWWRRRPLAELDGISEFQWWLLTEEALERMLLAAGFSRVERGKQFALPARGGGKWKGIRGIVRGYA